MTLGAALGLFVLARLTGVSVLAVTAWATVHRPLTLLGRSWDSRWYLGIAEHGYGRAQHLCSGACCRTRSCCRWRTPNPC